jgi:hypothetical protein
VNNSWIRIWIHVKKFISDHLSTSETT